MTSGVFASTGLTPHVLRLLPKQDLKHGLLDFVQVHSISAGCILTTVGSLQQASLRFAGNNSATVLTGPFEIVSLVGTLSPEGLHLHLAIADHQGKTIGGHVMPGCLIHTTAEIVIGALAGLAFRRSPDATTGYRELAILPATPTAHIANE